MENIRYNQSRKIWKGEVDNNMNKKIEEVLKNYFEKIDGNSTYGIIKGFEVNVFYDAFNSRAPLKIFISTFLTVEQREKIDLSLKAQKNKFMEYQFSRYGLFMGLNGWTNSSLAKSLPTVIDKVFGCLLENGALTRSYCPICGKEMSEEERKKAEIEGITVSMHGNCVLERNSEIQVAEKSFNSAPNNYLKGFLGAAIGGLLGVGLTVILYYLGYVSAITAVVSVALGAYLYKRFGGKPNGAMIVIVSATTLISLLGTVFGLYMLAAYGLSFEAGDTYGLWESFSIYMKDEDFAASFRSDMLMVLLFTGIGLFWMVGSLRKSIKREKEIRTKN